MRCVVASDVDRQWDTHTLSSRDADGRIAADEMSVGAASAEVANMG